MSQPEKKSKTGYIIFIVISLILAAYALYSGIRFSDAEKYAGHGFKYMHGYSSTNFKGYHVYDSEKLYKMDHEASLKIENPEDMPVLDGAEACYPVYSAMALAVYENTSEIEKDYHDRAEKEYKSEKFGEDYELQNVYINNGRYVTFTNSSDAYYRLIQRKADMVFAARPSRDQKEDASSKRETILSTPIGREAFVFFVEEDNPVSNLTSEEIRSIFSGKITDWSELGGKKQKIIAFQRPENSGSQVCMRWFMGDVPLADPDTYKVVSSMGGTVEQVKQYHSEAGAISYSFRYFLEGLQQEGNVKILSVDGVYPDIESIKDGSYPLTVPLVCATLASNDKPYVKKMMDFILSDDGQEIIEQTGYAPLADRNSEAIAENEFGGEGRVYTDENTDSNLTVYEPDQYGNVIFELETADQMIKGNLFDNYKSAYPENARIAESFDWEEILIFEYDSENDTYVMSDAELNRRNITLPEKGTAFRYTGGTE